MIDPNPELLYLVLTSENRMFIDIKLFYKANFEDLYAATAD